MAEQSPLTGDSAHIAQDNQDNINKEPGGEAQRVFRCLN